MPAKAPKDPAEPPTDDPVVDLGAITTALTFANVYTLGLTALRELSEPATGFRTTISPSYLSLEDRVDYLFSAKCEALSEENETVARISVDIVATFDLLRETVPAEGFSGEQITAFGGKVAIYSVYPYIRESIQSLGSRLGLPSLTLDLLKRGQPLPEGLSIGHEEPLTDAD